MEESTLKSFAIGFRVGTVLAINKGNYNARHQKSGLGQFLGDPPRR